MNKPASQEKKDKKNSQIVKVASDLFLNDGIEDIKMTDIADKCMLGVASLYRYFNVKKTIVIESGILIWKDRLTDFKKIEAESLDRHLTGMEEITKLLYHFYEMFLYDKNFFIFLRQFDNFCLREKVKIEELSKYDDVIMEIKDIFLRCTNRGVEDKSIKDDIDFTLTYFAFSKALIGLCQKLISEGKILSSDMQETDSKQIKILLYVLIDYFRR